MKKLTQNISFKIGSIVLIAILLQIPTAMIKNMIDEREQTQRLAINEVSSKWAKEQTISGPFLSIPYYKFSKEYSSKDSTERIIKYKEYLHILPTELNIESKVNPEKRYRGIYEVVVYNSTINISGYFNNIDFSEFDIRNEHILFEKSEFVVGIDDMRGIEKQIELNWNDEKISFNSGVSSKDIVNSGINASNLIKKNENQKYTFNLSLYLKGS